MRFETGQSECRQLHSVLINELDNLNHDTCRNESVQLTKIQTILHYASVILHDPAIESGFYPSIELGLHCGHFINLEDELRPHDL